MGYKLRWCLQVGFLQAGGGSVIVVVGEVKAAEVVKERNSLGGRIQFQWQRICRYIGEYLIRQMCFPALGNGSVFGKVGISGAWSADGRNISRIGMELTAKSSLRTRFANIYTPTFFPSGLPFLALDRSVRQVVKIFWMISADISATDLRSSSPPVSSRRPIVKSGRLLSIMVSCERASERDMLVCRSIPPYVGLAKAVEQTLEQRQKYNHKCLRRAASKPQCVS